MDRRVIVATNDQESGDWVCVLHDNDIIFSGHRVTTKDLIWILKSLNNGFDSFDHIDFTDEGLESYVVEYLRPSS